MATKTVGIREFKAQMGAYLKLVKDGSIIIITERGKPVGQIMPLSASLEERTQELIKAGVIQWSGKRLTPRSRGPRVRGKRNVADLLLEDRD